MHKLVLGSGGIFFNAEDDVILNHIFSLADKKDLFVYLPTAGHDGRNREDEIYDYCIRHGFKNAISLYLTDENISDEYIKNTILSADVIYAGGGDLKFLLTTWRKRKADKYLRIAYDNGTVIAGQSSGAMCWCNHGYDNCDDHNGKFMFFDGLGFIPYILCPHFEDYPFFLEDVKMQEYDAIGVDNDIAFSIVDGQYQIIDSGRNPKHSAFFMRECEEWKVHDLMKEKIHIPNLR